MPSTMANKVMKKFRLEPDLVDWLEEHVRAHGGSMTEIVERGIRMQMVDGGHKTVSAPQLIPTEDKGDGLKHIDIDALKASVPSGVPTSPLEEEKPPMFPEERERRIKERAAEISDETDLSYAELARKAELDLEEKGLIW